MTPLCRPNGTHWLTEWRRTMERARAVNHVPSEYPNGERDGLHRTGTPYESRFEYRREAK